MRRAVVLGAVAVGGTVAFTVTWVLLGWSHAGYRPRAETISSLSAHDAAGWPVMVLAQLTLAAAFASVSALALLALGRRGRVVAALLGLACLGTLQLSTFRTVCNHMDAGWCTPLPRSAYPHQQWLHGWGTALAFVMLQLACVACAWATWRRPELRDLAVVSVVAETVSLPFVLWFLANADTSWHGLAEKVFLAALGGWTAYAGVRLASVALSEARDPRGPGPASPGAGRRRPPSRPTAA